MFDNHPPSSHRLTDADWHDADDHDDADDLDIVQSILRTQRAGRLVVIR